MPRTRLDILLLKHNCPTLLTRCDDAQLQTIIGNAPCSSLPTHSNTPSPSSPSPRSLYGSLHPHRSRTLIRPRLDSRSVRQRSKPRPALPVRWCSLLPLCLVSPHHFITSPCHFTSAKLNIIEEPFETAGKSVSWPSLIKPLWAELLLQV